MSTIHGKSTKALHLFRDQPAALAVYWIYCARRNHEGVAFPSLRGLVRDTGWSINPCREAREWLLECEALEIVVEYVRPEWRKLPEADRKHLIDFDKTEYYRVTGRIVMDEQTFDMLYAPGNDAIDDVSLHETADVSRHDTSHHDISHGDTELDSIGELDSLKEKKAGAKKDRKPIERTDIFKVIALESFEIKDAALLDKTGVIRINRLAKWLKENSPGATDKTITEFYRWYDSKYKSAAKPRDLEKFADHFNAFKQQHLKSANGNGSRPVAQAPIVPPAIVRTPEQLAALHATQKETA